MNGVRVFFLIGLGLSGLWDGFTTFYGTTTILGKSPTQIAASIAFALTISGFLFGTKYVWKYNEEELLVYVLRAMWIVSFGYSLFTSFVGNRDIILGTSSTPEQFAILLGMTLLTSGSPIIFSFLWQDNDNNKNIRW